MNMGARRAILVLSLLAGLGFAKNFEIRIRSTELHDSVETLAPLHTKRGKSKPGEWLYEHIERGQTFEQYLKCGPVMPWGKRNKIYIQPIGGFTESQKKILDQTVEFMRIFYGRPVTIQSAISTNQIPAEAKRVHPEWGDKQILSTHVLDNILKPNLPEDAAVSLAFTATDLWPGEGWNFVFGQASLRARTGVWSIYRNGNPDESDYMYKRCLRRTIKTAIHETGHMFTMRHCTKYECGMAGSNHLEEADRHPLYFCCECNAKVCWATQQRPIERYEKLQAFCKKHGLKKEADFYTKSIKALKNGTTENKN